MRRIFYLILFLTCVSCSQARGDDVYTAFECNSEPNGGYLILHFMHKENSEFVRYISMNKNEMTYKLSWGDHNKEISFLVAASMNQSNKIVFSKPTLRNADGKVFLKFRSDEDIVVPSQWEDKITTVSMGNEIPFGYVDESCMNLVLDYIPNFVVQE